MKMFFVVFFLSLLAQAEKKHAHHAAHVHGAGKLNIAFDGTVGKWEFEAAAEAILGFEHEAKSDKDKKKLSQTISKFESEPGKIVKFDSSLNCKMTKDRVGLEKGEGAHADFEAVFHINCEKSVAETKLELDFTAFPGLKDVDVTVLANDLQKSGEYKGKVLTLELK